MIFQTNNDNTGIITFLQARKLAEQELTATIQQKQAVLAVDAVALKTYEVEVAKGAVSTERFTTIMKGASTEAQNYAVSTKGATGSTQTFVANQQKTINALKNTEKASLSASLGVKALNIALNMGAMLAFSLAVKAVTWAVDTAIITLEEQKEKVDECASAYESAQTELSSITSELESQTRAMNDLLAKDKLTYAEQGQLEELQQITKELQIQKDIADRKEVQSQKDLAVESAKLVNKQYGKETASLDKISEYEQTADITGNNVILISDENNLSSMIAGYRQFNELFDEAYSSKNEDDIENFKDLTDKVSTSIWNIVDSLSAQQSNMQDYYEAIKNTPYEDLTTDQKMVVDAYKKTADEIKLVYSELSPEEWNDMEISNIFNSDGIEKTKDKLIEMAQSGELTPETIASYKNLNGAIENSEIFLKNGQTAAQAFCNEIYACAEAKDELNSGTGNETPILSISDTITKLNTQLKPAFDSLKSAYQDIFIDDDFALENVDISMLDGIKSQLESLGKELNVEIDYSSFENFASVLNDTESKEYDVQKAFNELATTITNTALSGVEDFETLKAALEDFGIENSELVAFENLIGNTESLKKAGLDLATASEAQIIAFANEVVSAENVAQAIDMLTFAKLSADAANMDTSTEVANLKTLGENAGYTGDVIKYLTELEQIYQGIASGTIPSADIPEKLERAKELTALIQSSANNINYEPKFNGNSGKSSASKAGKEAADAYLEAFEKELQKLDDLKSQGKISEKQYLDALRRLYVKYFNQKKKYLDQYEKYESQYLQGMKSLYESAFSYITKQIDKRINALNDEKDTAVSSLEAERDARLEAIELQKEQLENEIDGIEKQIKAKEKEIKALQDANAERKREIDLQKAQYDLERMQNQKTSNVYKDGQMIWTPDTTGIRDAREEVNDAKLEIEISKMEKEVDFLNDQKDLLQEQIDLLDKQAESINAYYDKLIANTEAHYDSMVKGLEDTKSKFEDLSEVFENAQMEATLKELGINMDALLAGSEEEFNKLKTAYIGILSDISRGNDGVIDQLSRLGGVSAESISYLENTKGAFESLGETTVAPLVEEVDGIVESTGELSSSAGDVSTAINDVGTNASAASASIAPLNEELDRLKNLLDELVTLFASFQFPEIGDENYAQKLETVATAFGNIAEKCKEFQNIDFSSVIGSVGDTPTDPTDGIATEGTGTGFKGLVTALSDAVAIIQSQMDALQGALETGNDAFSDQIKKIQNDYIPAWEGLQTRLAEIIGVGGGGDKKDGKKQGSNKKDSKSESDSGDGSIIDIMQTGGDEVSAKLDDPWLKSFNEFATGENSVQSICELIKTIVNNMASSIQDQCAAAAKALQDLAEQALNSSISVGGGNGGGKSRGGGGNDNVTDGGYKGTVGSAFADGTTGFGKIRSLPITGYKGLPSDVKNALRSEYGQPELTVYPNGKTELTTEPTMSSLPKGTVIFNEEQTNRIMNNKGKLIGNAFADGTGDGTIVTKDGQVLRSLQPGDRMYELIQKMGKMLDTGTNMFIPPTNAMTQAAESMDKVTNLIKNNNINQTTTVTMNGGIHLHGVQDVNSLSREINLRLPNMILQDSHRR